MENNYTLDVLSVPAGVVRGVHNTLSALRFELFSLFIGSDRKCLIVAEQSAPQETQPVKIAEQSPEFVETASAPLSNPVPPHPPVDSLEAERFASLSFYRASAHSGHRNPLRQAGQTFCFNEYKNFKRYYTVKAKGSNLRSRGYR